VLGWDSRAYHGAATDPEALMRDDEDIAERVEREHAAEFAARKSEVDAAIADGAG